MAERRAFDEGPWPRLKATERGLAVRNIAEAIRRRADELIAREVADIRMPIAQMKQLAARGREFRLPRGGRHRAPRPDAQGRR